MDIIYAAEKPSIAKLLGERLRRPVDPRDIKVSENPDQTGSFFVGFQFDKYVLAPNGDIVLDRLELVE